MARGLLQHSDFLKLWAGQTISVFGSQVTSLALPLTAVLTLGASPRQMGLLGAVQYAPFLLVGLFAGVWVDRLHRRPLLIGADIGRMVLIGSLPLAAVFDLLRIEQLYLAGFLNGILTVFFDVAWQSYLPSLVERTDLVEGNSRLESSRAVAQVAGPGLAGALIQLVSSTGAMAIDAVSFGASALCLSLIRRMEQAPATVAERRSIWTEIGDGLRLVVRDPLLRPLAACTATLNLFASMIGPVYLIYVSRDRGLSPATIGAVSACAGVGGLLGAAISGRAVRRIGLGRTIVAGTVLMCGGAAGIPLVGGSPQLTAVLLGAVWLIGTIGGPLYNINQVSLRQSITPDRLQGRVNATMRFLVWGVIPVGALAGGALGGRFGARPTLFTAAAGQSVALLWLALSRVPRLRAIPAHSPPPSAVAAGLT